MHQYKSILVGILVSSSVASAQTATTTAAPTTGTTTDQVAGAALLANSAASSGGNASGGSKASSALAIVGMGLTGAIGVVEGMDCAKTPPNVMACIMAAQCVLQIVSTLSSQKGSDGVNAAYTPGSGTGAAVTGDPNSDLSGSGAGGTGTNGSGTNAANLASTAGFANADLKKIQGLLSTAGVTLGTAADGSGTVTLPNGQTVPINSTPDSLKSAGFDSGQIADALADAKKVELNAGLKASAAPVGYQSLGGGHATAGALNPNASMDGYGSNPNALDGGRRKPGSVIKQSVAGLSRKLGDESIGVKGDDIFQMVNRRYRAQDQQNAFLHEK